MRVASLVAAAMLAAPVSAQPPGDAPAPAPLVFFDIAGQESAKLAAFYRDVFGWRIAADGSFTTEVRSPPLVPHPDYPTAAGFTTSVAAPLPGQIRPDPAEKRLYLGVPDVTAALTSIEARGGTVQAPRFEVPGVVVLGLFADPAGNPMGLVEMDGDRVKIP